MDIDICSLCRRSPALLLLFTLGCASQESQELGVPRLSNRGKSMKVVSSGFEDNATLDVKFSVEGADISPPLAWSEVPAETKSFALICDDPDAPSPRRPAAEPWVHWVIFNIPPDRSELPEGIGNTLRPEALPEASQGKNSWPNDNVGYRGPAPPPGSGPHRYFFKIYALDAMLNLEAGATKQQLLEAMSGHVVAEAQLVGIYER